MMGGMRGVRGCLAVVVALACLGAAAGSARTDDWSVVQVRVVTIHYRTHDGYRRSAELVLPDWYGPRNNPPLPLIISPHGRGVSADENVNRWGNLPALGPFAVVNPEGQGRRFERLSWGYPGQIEDLARMPGIVRKALPWLRLDERRIYAFGASMGGQETLLLVARHPSLLAGAAAFDPVTNMASRYRDFARLRCNRTCARRWRDSIGPGLRQLARREIGGTPATHPRAYARRSPLTYARAIADSGVPLQLWWSTSDRVVRAGDQSVPLVRALRRLNPNMELQTFVGSWPHSADMHQYFMLVPALKRFGLMSVRTPQSLRRASSRPVHPLLPWHRAVLDGQGRLLPWYKPDAGLGYDHVLRIGWRFIEQRVPRDPRTGSKVFLNYAVFDGQTLHGIYWQHNPAFLNAAFVDSLVAWYPYSGDRRAIRTVRQMLDYQLAHGTTPTRWSWAGVPFATSCAGDRKYGRCLAGVPRRYYGGLETDKVGLLGLGYLQFYELTGERRYLRAAVRAGAALARHVRAGDATHTPWPFRVDARTGRVLDGAQFGGMVVGPVRLLDELIEIGAGNTAAYRHARDLAWSWLLANQLNPDSAAWNDWSGFYEDVPFNPKSRNQASPTMTAHYLLTRDSPETIDPLWDEHAASLLTWVRTSFGRGPFHGAWGIDEQWAPGRPGCCSKVGLGSTTSRWAAANAMLYARTGDERARELAIRSLNYSTYFEAGDGRISCCGRRSFNTFWFSDGYADYLRSFNWAMAAVPELAPKRRDHLLGSSSVVQSVSYGRRRVAYRTFDGAGTDVLRLSFRPRQVSAGATLHERADLAAEGYVVQPLGGGDFALRIRRDHARRIRVAG
jgi:pimeloyl-ACP methyl ester carboxylesterase